MSDLASRAPYRIHRMIQDLMRDPKAAAAFAADPQPVFAAYGVLAQEAVLLEASSIEAMTELGVHPNLQMKYLRLRKPAGAGPTAGLLDGYIDRLREG